MFLNSVLVAIYGSFSIHCVFIQAVGVEILLVDVIGYFEEVCREALEEVDDECSFAFVFFQHPEDEVLQFLGVGDLKREGLFVEDFAHEALVGFVVEGDFEGCHVVHDDAEAEDV